MFAVAYFGMKIYQKKKILNSSKTSIIVINFLHSIIRVLCNGKKNEFNRYIKTIHEYMYLHIDICIIRR